MTRRRQLSTTAILLVLLVLLAVGLYLALRPREAPAPTDEPTDVTAPTQTEPVTEPSPPTATPEADTMTPQPSPPATEPASPTAVPPAEDSLHLSIEPATAIVKAGERFTLQVLVANVDDLGAFEFALAYDPAVMSVTEMRVGEFLGGSDRSLVPLGPEIDEDAGVATFGAFTFGESAGPDGSGTVATIICQALTTGTTAVRLTNVQVTDTQAVVLTPETILEGRVTVQSS